MVAINKKYHVALQVHDENVVVVPAAEALAAQQLMEKEMSTPPTWAPDLPVACESAVGDTYGACK